MLKKNRLKIIFLAMQLIAVTGCGRLASTSNDNTMTKYEVVLSIDNYKTYLNITYSWSTHPLLANWRSANFEGCLDYAFYDNVVITVSYYDSESKSKYSEHIEDVSLNAAGRGSVSGHYLEITNAKGKVIYWI